MTRSFATAAPTIRSLRTPHNAAQGAVRTVQPEGQAFQSHLADAEASTGAAPAEPAFIAAQPEDKAAPAAQDSSVAATATTLTNLLAAATAQQTPAPATQEAGALPAASDEPADQTTDATAKAAAPPAGAISLLAPAIYIAPPASPTPTPTPTGAPSASPASALNALSARRTGAAEASSAHDKTMMDTSTARTPAASLPDASPMDAAPLPQPAADAVSAAPAATTTPAATTAARAIPPEAVPMTIAAYARDGAKTFEIRLDPVELGRVDVRLSIDHEGAIRTHIVVERPETLQLLRNDSQRLDQAFSDAGLKADNASFSLRGEGGQDQRPAFAAATTAQTAASDDDAPARPALPAAIRAPSAASRIDLMI